MESGGEEGVGGLDLLPVEGMAGWEGRSQFILLGFQSSDRESA